MVLNAGFGDDEAAWTALEKLCRTYWPAVNAYIRRCCRNPADAEDLTQQFFARFLEKEHFRRADPGRGRFRAFLLTCVRNFLINARESASAQKRGGGQLPLSLDADSPDGGRAIPEPVDQLTAELLYEQNWALALLARSRERLAEEWNAAGRGDRYAVLETMLPGEEAALTYAEAALRFGVAEGTIKSDMHRLKRRFGELLREELAHTLSSASEMEDELRHLQSVFSK
jgi:RNA polymerase sigma factor (sigma-70 family)